MLKKYNNRPSGTGAAGLVPNDIDILVTTCSIFCPTPSLASMVVNHFQMRPDIQSYHLGGMGCSNGVVAVNLIQDMLKVGFRALFFYGRVQGTASLGRVLGTALLGRV